MIEERSPLLNVDEAAAYLRCGENAIRRLLNTKQLIGIKNSSHGAWRISRSSLDSYIAEQERLARLDRPRSW